MKVVVDTNVWLSALRFGGEVAKVLQIALETNELVVSQFILTETERVLVQKFSVSESQLRSVLSSIRSYSTVETPTGTPPTVCRDPNDNHVLHLCKHVAANVLLTGDKDLLVLKTFEGTRILSPKQFTELLRD